MQTEVVAQGPGGQRFDMELFLEMKERDQRRKDKRAAERAQILQEQQQKARADPQGRIDDWEVNALRGIKSKGLGLHHDWAERTWANKATIKERLKLLKDEGVNITPLQTLKKDRSATISKALKALADARRAQKPATQQESVTQQESMTQQEPVLDVASALTVALKAPEEPFDPLFDELEAFIDETPSSPTKKRTRHEAQLDATPEEPTANTSEEQTEEPLTYKKLCRMSLRSTTEKVSLHTEANYHVWAELKAMILCKIFGPCRAAVECEPERGNAPASHVVIKFPSLDDPVAAGPLELGELGYTSIMDELRVLSDHTEETGTIHILEPAVTGDAVRQDIKVVTSIRHQTVLEGNLVALMGLLSRLAAKKTSLAHYEKQSYDAAGMRKERGMPWELSDKTQEQLEMAKDALEAGWEAGAMDVTLCWKSREVYKKPEV